MSSPSATTLRATPSARRLPVGRFLFIAVAALVVLAANFTAFSAYSLNILMQASTYAIAVLGLTIVLGYTGQINLAQAAFFSLGAYCVALGTTSFGIAFFPALALGLLLAGIAGGFSG